MIANKDNPDADASNSSANPLAVLRCTKCLQVRPIEHFRWENKAKGKRHSWCTTCEVDRQREMRQRRRGKRIHRFNYEVRRRRSAEAIGILCDEIMREFGGPRYAAAFWREALDRASTAGNHATVLNSFATIAKLEAAYEEIREKASELSDEDLAAAQERGLAALIQRYPQLAVQAAHSIGWEVVPPTTSEDPDVPEDSLSGV